MRALILVAGASLALGLAACGDNDETRNQNMTVDDNLATPNPQQAADRAHVQAACGHIPGPRETISGECAAAKRDYEEQHGTLF